MMALPLHQTNNVPAALILPARGNRASLAFSSSGLAHQFHFQSPYQISRQALADMAHHLTSLLSVLTQWMKIYTQARTIPWEVTTNCRGTI